MPLAGHHKATTVQILHISFCELEPTMPIWTQVATIVQMTHGVAICVLALVQFVKQSLQMYRATKQWQLNRYMNFLVSQGILYFLVYVPISFPPHIPLPKQSPTQLMCHGILVFSLINVLGVSGKLPTGGWQGILLFLLGYVPMFTLVPRFIVSIRKMYARGVQSGGGGGIDTGFGLSSSSRDAGGTAIVFADVEQNEDFEDVSFHLRRGINMAMSAR